jgi:hypothetical protein
MKIINSPVRNIAPESFGFESRFPVVYARKSKAKAQAKKAAHKRIPGAQHFASWHQAKAKGST